MERRKRLLTVAQVADRLGVSVNTVRRWADQGFIPVARTPTGHRRFDPDQIEAVVAGMTPASLLPEAGVEVEDRDH